MNITTQYAPANTIAKLEFSPGEEWTTEAGAMVAMSSGLDIETTTHKKGKRGILKGLARMLAGESFFMNHYQATQDSVLWLAPTMSGDIVKHQLSGEKIIVQSGSFLACDSKIDLSTGWQGFKNLLSGESLFWLHLQGEGEVLFSTFGAVYTIDVENEYVVDTGHIVAFEETLDFSLSKAGSSWMHSALGGEGIICRFKGQGRIWCQSHNLRNFGMSLRSSLKTKKR